MEHVPHGNTVKYIWHSPLTVDGGSHHKEGQPNGITQILGCPVSKPHIFGGPIPRLKATKTSVTAFEDGGGDPSNQE